MEVVGDADQTSLPESQTRNGVGGAIRRIGLNLALMAGGLLVAVLLLELLMRVFNPQLLYRYPKDLFMNDAAIGYRLTPGFSGEFSTTEYTTAVNVNSAGLRDSRELGAKPAGAQRILFLGDSFTMGHSVEERENFVRLVEDGLNAAAGKNLFTALNSGVPGYSTRDELAFLRSRGFALEPDAIVLAFFIGNDVVDNANFGRHMQVVDGYLTDGDQPPGILPFSVRSALARHSHLYYVLYPLQRKLRGMELQHSDDPLLVCDRSREKLWEPTQAALAEMKRLADEHHVPLYMVVIPDMVQVDSGLWQRAIQERPQLDPNHPSQRLQALGAALDIPVLDLQPVLMQHTAQTPLYYPLDHHWTPAGNRVAADAIVPFLRSELAPRS